MATERQRFDVTECPYCHRPHAMMVEMALRNVGVGHSAVRLEQVQTVCKYTGHAFLAAIEVSIPAGRRLGRLRAVTMANGD